MPGLSTSLLFYFFNSTAVTNTQDLAQIWEQHQSEIPWGIGGILGLWLIQRIGLLVLKKGWRTLISPVHVIVNAFQNRSFKQILLLLLLLITSISLMVLVTVMVTLSVLFIADPIPMTTLAFALFNVSYMTFSIDDQYYYESLLLNSGVIGLLLGILIGFSSAIALGWWGMIKLGVAERPTWLTRHGLKSLITTSKYYQQYAAPFRGPQIEIALVIPSLLLLSSFIVSIVGFCFWTLYQNASPIIDFIYVALFSSRMLDPRYLSQALQEIGPNLLSSLAFSYVVWIITLFPLLGFWWECCRIWHRQGFGAPLPPFEARWPSYWELGLNAGIYFMFTLPLAPLFLLFSRGKALIWWLSPLVQTFDPQQCVRLFQAVPKQVQITQNHPAQTKALLQELLLLYGCLALLIVLTFWTLLIPVALVQIGAMVTWMRLVDYSKAVNNG